VVSFRPTDDQLYYFNYANGFRPGNVNNGMEFNIRQFTAAGLPQQFIDQAASLLTYESDEVDSFELGAKLTFADGRAQLATAAYYMDWSDTIMLFSDPTIPSVNQSFNQNAGAAHSQGLELELTWMPVDSLNVRLAADFNEAETDKDNLANNVPEGNSLIYAPEWSASLSVDYVFNIGSLQARLRADHQRVDEQFGDPQNTLKIDEYDVTNLRLTLADPADNRWSASLFANNVTGEDAVVSLFTLVGTTSNVYLQPRVVGLEFTWQAR
jgi:iron complex outermembrane receptor protein